MKLYNLTGHNQSALAEIDLTNHGITEVEEVPRLRPVNNPTDFQELKAITKEAVKGIEPGSAVLIGGLGQFQALIQQLPYRVFFANFNFAEKRIEGLIPFVGFTRQEIFEIENNL
jgi:hypothetical protein